MLLQGPGTFPWHLSGCWAVVQALSFTHNSQYLIVSSGKQCHWFKKTSHEVYSWFLVKISCRPTIINLVGLLIGQSSNSLGLVNPLVDALVSRRVRPFLKPLYGHSVRSALLQLGSPQTFNLLGLGGSAHSQIWQTKPCLPLIRLNRWMRSQIL